MREKHSTLHPHENDALSSGKCQHPEWPSKDPISTRSTAVRGKGAVHRAVPSAFAAAAQGESTRFVVVEVYAALIGAVVAAVGVGRRSHGLLVLPEFVRVPFPVGGRSVGRGRGWSGCTPPVTAGRASLMGRASGRGGRRQNRRSKRQGDRSPCRRVAAFPIANARTPTPRLWSGGRRRHTCGVVSG